MCEGNDFWSTLLYPFLIVFMVCEGNDFPLVTVLSRFLCNTGDGQLQKRLSGLPFFPPMTVLSTLSERN